MDNSENFVFGVSTEHFQSKSHKLQNGLWVIDVPVSKLDFVIFQEIIENLA